MSSVACRLKKADIFYKNQKNRVRLTAWLMYVPKAVKKLCNCSRTSCKIILLLDKLTKTEVSSSAVTLKSLTLC